MLNVLSGAVCHCYCSISGKPDKLIGSGSTLKRRITKEVKVFCSVSLKDDETTAVKCKEVTITPKLGQ